MAYSNSFELAINKLMEYEIGGSVKLTISGFIDGTNLTACGYVDDPNDAGGETKYGIAKNANPSLDIKNLKWADAKEVYFNHYWLAGSCDKMPGRVASLHFDGCVNNGVGAASKFLQRAVSVDDDGNIGPHTLDAINNGDEYAICQAICDQRIDYYNRIVARKPDQKKYLTGWLRRINEMLKFTTDQSRDFDS